MHPELLNDLKFRFFGNKKNIKTTLRYNLAPSPKKNVVATALKKHANTQVKIFRSCVTLIDFLIFLKYFAQIVGYAYVISHTYYVALLFQQK